MLDLTFGEQVKIILSRKGMTIKELAENIEERTGKKMSRQNLTQRLGRDNFQEQDMRMIAKILGCSFHLSILEDDIQMERADDTYYIEENEKKVSEKAEKVEKKNVVSNVAPERDITLGELVEMYEEEPQEAYEAELQNAYIEEPQEFYSEELQEAYVEEPAAEVYEEELTAETYEETPVEKVHEEEPATETYKEEPQAEPEVVQKEEKKPHGWRAYFKRLKKQEPVKREEPVEELVQETQDTTAEDITAENMYEESFGENAYEAGVYTEDSYTGDLYTGDTYTDNEGTYADIAYEENLYEEPAVAYEDEGDAGQEMYEEEPAEEFYEPEEEEDLTKGERNPYTGREYESNSVRMHPTRIGYVQVYDRTNHQWTDMTEWAFLGYQERKKALLGKDYEPPIYLD